MDDVLPLGNSCRKVVTRSQTNKTKLPTIPEDASPSEGPSTPGDMASDAAVPGNWKVSAASWVNGCSVEELRAAQLADPNISPLMDWLAKGERPTRDEAASLSPEVRSFWMNFGSARLLDGVVYVIWVDSTGTGCTSWKLIIPRSLRPRVLQSCHDDTFSANLGVNKTVNKVKQRFHWLGLRRDVKDHIRSCATCSANKMPYRKFRAALVDFRVGAPMDRVAVDILSPIPPSKQGNRYLWFWWIISPVGWKHSPYPIRRLKQLHIKSSTTSSAGSEPP